MFLGDVLLKDALRNVPIVLIYNCDLINLIYKCDLINFNWKPVYKH